MKVIKYDRKKIINERYSVDKLGGGGMSTVYLAEDTILNIKLQLRRFLYHLEKRRNIKTFWNRKYITHHSYHIKI